jgi:hypothetical protein
MREEPRACDSCKTETLHQRRGWWSAIALVLGGAWRTRDRGWICARCAWKRIATERRARRKSTTIYVDF